MLPVLQSSIPVLEVAIIFSFFALMLAIGLYHYVTKRWSGERDYFVAGGKVGPVLIGLSYMATLYSMFTFLGAVGLFTAIGLSFTSLMYGEIYVMAILMPTLGYKFHKISQEREHVTPGDIMAERFGGANSVRGLVAIVLIASMLIYLTIQYVGISLVLESVTDGFLSFNAVVIIMFLVGGIYIAIGGMDSVVITDAIQAVLLTFGMVVLLGVVFINFDPTQMVQTALAANPSLGGLEPSIGSVAWLSWSIQMFAFGFGMVLWPQLWVRTFAADSRRGLMGIMLAMMFAQLFLIGTVGYWLAIGAPTALGSIPENADMIAILITEQYLPTWLGALILAGGAAAALSTLDSVALVLGSIAEKDLIRAYVVDAEKLTERQSEIMSRVSAFALMGIGAFLVFFGPTGLIAQLLVSFGYPAVAGIFPAVVLSMYWRGATKNGAALGIIGGAGIVFLQQVLGVIPTYGVYAGGWGILVGTVLTVGVSLVEGKTTSDTLVDVYGLR